MGTIVNWKLKLKMLVGIPRGRIDQASAGNYKFGAVGDGNWSVEFRYTIPSHPIKTVPRS